MGIGIDVNNGQIYREFAKMEHPENTDNNGFYYGPLSVKIENEQDFADAVAQISITGQQID